MNVTAKTIIGAHAYAVIKTAASTYHVLLSPEKSAAQSLRESAANMREQAARLLRRAQMCEDAADVI